jgi:hypothetical protein
MMKKEKPMKISRLSLICALALTGCNSSNYVETLVPESSVVKHMDVEGYQDRYANLYSKFKDYPVTCTENCYPSTERITCESDMENCKFIGSNPKLEPSFLPATLAIPPTLTIFATDTVVSMCVCYRFHPTIVKSPPTGIARYIPPLKMR